MPRYTPPKSADIDALEQRMTAITQCQPERAGVAGRTLLGCTPRTYYQWRSESVPIPSAIRVLMRAVLLMLTDDQLREVLNVNTRALLSARQPEQRNDD